MNPQTDKRMFTQKELNALRNPKPETKHFNETKTKSVHFDRTSKVWLLRTLDGVGNLTQHTQWKKTKQEAFDWLKL
jgi:hypothetical protein